MRLHKVLIKAIQYESTVIGLLELKASPHHSLCEVVILLFSVQLKWPWPPQELSTLVRTTCRTLTQSQQPALSHYPSSRLEMEMPVTAMSFLLSPPLLSPSSPSALSSLTPQPQEGEVSLLLCTFSLFFCFWSLQGICLILSPTLLLYLCLAFTTVPFCCCLPPQTSPPPPFPYTVEKS